VYFVSELAQSELKSGRVYAPADTPAPQASSEAMASSNQGRADVVRHVMGCHLLVAQ